jgi:DNA invertase Pin-like site-specific DNA recombinase
MKTATRTTAFIYIRVSTPSQQVDEQIKTIKQYAQDHDIEIVGQYGDYQKRHKAHKRQSFQAMLEDIKTLRPRMILVQRLDRFGTNGPNQLGSFLTTLKESKARLITTIDGMDRSKEDMATVLQNMIAACQSTQEQIDKAERVLTGKRGKAILGEYVGGKYLAFGFDVVCIGKEGQEKWRLVEDAWDCRIKYVLNDKSEYVEDERYGNEIIKDSNAIMPDKEVRHRPTKDTSDRLYYSPSIRQERVDTLRRICEWFDAGWTTYRIAQQLNDEGNKPVHADHWYTAFIDGLLENTVLIGKPTWNRTSQSTFRQVQGNRIVEPAEEMRAVYRHNDRTDWFQPAEEVYDQIIPQELFDRIQAKLEARKQAGPRRSPRSEELWFGGLWYCGETDLKLAGNNQGKHFKVKHPDHHDKRLTFKEAECFIGEYLRRIGQRLDTLGECLESRKLLEKLAHEEWMKELRLEWIILEVQSYLESKLQPGMNTVGGMDVILDHDDEMNAVISTDASYLDLYALMVKEDMEQNQQAVQEKMEERKRLAVELMMMKNKTPYIIDAYNEQIERLSREIEQATSLPDFLAWWQEVQAEVELLRQKQGQVQQSLKEGTWVQKALAIRNLIDRIVCHWEKVPTKDGRHKSGFKTVCSRVDVYPAPVAGQAGEIMTIETSSE